MTKMLRRALLGGAAVAMMAAGAQAGELEALKAQLEALQNRVATMESRSAALPEGASLITFERGSTASADELFNNAALDQAPASRGTTIAITPTADLPAPVASIELSGYIRAVALWQSSPGNDTGLADNDSAKLSDFDLLARGQIDLKATTDTAVGRVTGGIQLRGNMGGVNGSYTPALNIRTAWATWQMTDALSLTFGETGQIAALSNVSYGTIATPVGLDSSRRPQFRLTYASGPFNLRFGIEDSSQGDTGANQTAMPDIAGSMGINMGMFGFRAGGEVGKVRTGVDFKTGWLANAGINMNLGSMVSMSLGGAYTKGLATDGLISAGTGAGLQGVVGGLQAFNATNDLVKAWALAGNMTFTMTDTTSLLLSAGYVKQKNENAANLDKAWSVGGALVYRPVEALQFAAEADYFSYKATDGDKGKAAIVGVAGWFFF